MNEFIKKRKDETQKEFAYRSLRESIMSLELKPGQGISESEIADKFGLSRTPVREIIMKLKDEHLVEVVPQKGTYVSLIDLNLVYEGNFTRTTLEKEVIKLACKGIKEEFIRELDRNIYEYEYVVDDDTAKGEKHLLDKNFHKIIFASVGMENVYESIQRLSTHYNRVRILSEIRESDRHILEEHKELLKYIREGNIEKASIIVDTHIESPTEKWKELYGEGSQFREYFNV